MTKEQIIEALTNKKNRSRWSEAVTQYAIDILTDLEGEPTDIKYDTINNWLLNGAKNWKQYSYCGSSLCYDGDIAERVCTHSEFEKTFLKGKNPNKSETWLDCQARALYQASNLIYNMYCGVK